MPSTCVFVVNRGRGLRLRRVECQVLGELLRLWATKLRGERFAARERLADFLLPLVDLALLGLERLFVDIFAPLARLPTKLRLVGARTMLERRRGAKFCPRDLTPLSFMFATVVRWSRTTYRGARGSGPGRSGKTDARSSPASRPTEVVAAHAGHTFKRAQRGLYGGKILQFGNSIPNSRHKSARRWVPNVQPKSLWSETLQKWVHTRVATSAMRSINKHGGLDQYLARTKGTHLGEFGRQLRDRVARTLRDRRLMQS